MYLLESDVYTLKIFVLCQRNLVRSPIISAILSKSMPEVSVKSAGLEAIQDTQIPSVVKQIVHDWQLGELKSSADSVSNFKEEILESDLVLLTERHQLEHLNAIGFKRDWITITDKIVDDSFIALDPFGFKLSDMKIEIAKIVIGTLRIISYSLQSLELPNILTITPNTPSDTGIAYAHAFFEKNIKNAALIDIDLRSPCARDFAENFSVIEYDPMDSAPFSLSDANKKVIFTPYKEFSFPEKYLINENLRGKIHELSKALPVIQISAPRVTSKGLLADSILASCDSRRVSRISC